jgi:hypothetical protein
MWEMQGLMSEKRDISGGLMGTKMTFESLP